MMCCILYFSASASETKIDLNEYINDLGCILCFIASPSETMLYKVKTMLSLSCILCFIASASRTGGWWDETCHWSSCILCFSASASETSPLWRAHLRLSAFICGCILCFSASASRTFNSVYNLIQLLVLHPLFQRNCLSNFHISSKYFIIHQVASSVSSQVPLRRSALTAYSSPIRELHPLFHRKCL